MFRLSVLLIFVAGVVSGCADMQGAMTPGVAVQKDPFDGSLRVHQPLVSAASSMSEAWHLMGFEWHAKTPNAVSVDVGITGSGGDGVKNIYRLEFRVDGKPLPGIAAVNPTTTYEGMAMGMSRSYRRFTMPMDQFELLAIGKDVRMRLTIDNAQSVSSFGSANSGAVVTVKFAPFLAKIKGPKR